MGANLFAPFIPYYAPKTVKEKVSKLNESAHLEKIEDLLAAMTLKEKIGQMSQLAGSSSGNGWLPNAIRNGEVGSILNQVGVHDLNELQRVAVEESRLGIPIIFCPRRDSWFSNYDANTFRSGSIMEHGPY